MTQDFTYDTAKLSLKVLVTFFLLFVGMGYVFGLMNIRNNTGFSYTGVVVHYRGDDKDMAIPQDFASAKLVQEHHVHMFSLSMLFFMVGILFSFTRLPEVPKALFIGAPFLGMGLDFSGFWLTVFSSPLFAWGSIFFGAFMGISFFFLIGRPLYEMWILPIWEKKWGINNVPKFLR